LIILAVLGAFSRAHAGRGSRQQELSIRPPRRPCRVPALLLAMGKLPASVSARSFSDTIARTSSRGHSPLLDGARRRIFHQLGDRGCGIARLSITLRPDQHAWRLENLRQNATWRTMRCSRLAAECPQPCNTRPGVLPAGQRPMIVVRTIGDLPSAIWGRITTFQVLPYIQRQARDRFESP